MSDAPRRLEPGDVEAVVALARIVWQATYPALIPQAQIEFMLADRYAATRIRDQLSDPHHAWWIAGNATGLAHAYIEPRGCKLDKLYVHPDQQRCGVGTSLFNAVAIWARAHHATRLFLQVNRGNTQAVGVYEKWGFCIAETRVFDIGGGFVMDDYVMEKSL